MRRYRYLVGTRDADNFYRAVGVTAENSTTAKEIAIANSAKLGLTVKAESARRLRLA